MQPPLSVALARSTVISQWTSVIDHSFTTDISIYLTVSSMHSSLTVGGRHPLVLHAHPVKGARMLTEQVVEVST